MSVARILEAVATKAEPEQQKAKKQLEWKSIKDISREAVHEGSNFPTRITLKLEQAGPRIRISMVNEQGRPVGLRTNTRDCSHAITLLQGMLEDMRNEVAEIEQQHQERTQKRDAGRPGERPMRVTGKTEKNRQKKLGKG